MFTHGIGLDCAGYVQQAFLSVQGISRENAGFHVARNENLSGLAARGFTRVSIDDIRPGDLLILGPVPRSNPHAVGHTAIVYDVHDTTEEEHAYLQRAGRVPTTTSGPRAMRTIVLDSSWGNGGDPTRGGVQRRSFWQDKTTGLWTWSDPSGVLRSGPAGFPYDHPIEGFYRRRQ
jgi:cell wall-associated NlpC family hydrolase